jgi:hypothetical protein
MKDKNLWSQLTGGKLTDEVENNFVSVYSCPSTPNMGGWSRSFPSYEPIPPVGYNPDTSFLPAIPFMSGYGMNESNVVKRIKDSLTVSEYDILCHTTCFSDEKQIVKYQETIKRLIDDDIFKDRCERDESDE